MGETVGGIPDEGALHFTFYSLDIILDIVSYDGRYNS